MQTPHGFYEKYRIHVQTRSQAVEINRDEKYVRVEMEGGGYGGIQGYVREIPYDRLVLSQGAVPIVPKIPGSSAHHCFTLRDMDDMEKIDKLIRTENPKDAVVVGGGFIGLEMTEALVKRGLHIRLIEKSAQIMPTMDPEFGVAIQRYLEECGVEVLTGKAVAEVDPEALQVITEEDEEYPAQLVIFSVGIRPEFVLAKNAGLEIGSTGAVKVNSLLQSVSDPDIFVVGDMAEITHAITGRRVRVPLGGPANRQGRIAGNNAATMGSSGRLIYSGAMGTSVVKLFDKTLAMTGLSEKAAKDAGFSVGCSIVHPYQHASYFPGAERLMLKLVYNDGTGQLLGAQAFGGEGVDKRIDVIAMAIHGKMTVKDLEVVDLAYAPPYSSAVDPVNLAGYVANNARTGFSPVVAPTDAAQIIKTGDVRILDVRSPEEFVKGHLQGALNLPLEKIRDHIAELPIDDTYVVHCQYGARGHVASRILLNKGFKSVYNVSGGLASMELAGVETFKAAEPAVTEQAKPEEIKVVPTIGPKL